MPTAYWVARRRLAAWAYAAIEGDHAADGSLDAPGDGPAVVQEGASVPREWAEGFARLESQPAPRTVTPATWLALIDAAGRFLDEWGSKAAALGWTASYLFGLDPAAPINRRDSRGAAFYLIDAEVLALTADAIAIRVGGQVQQIYRCPKPTAPAWEIDL